MLCPGRVVKKTERGRKRADCSELFGVLHSDIEALDSARGAAADCHAVGVGTHVVVLLDKRHNNVGYEVGELLALSVLVDIGLGRNVADVGCELLVTGRRGIRDAYDNRLLILGNGTHTLINAPRAVSCSVLLKEVLTVSHIDNRVLFFPVLVVAVGRADVNFFFVALKIKGFERVIDNVRLFLAVGKGHNSVDLAVPAADTVVERKLYCVVAVTGKVNLVEAVGVAVASVEHSVVILAELFD